MHVKEEKQEVFLSILKEFDFISDVQVIERNIELDYENLVSEAEKDIREGRVSTQKDFEREILQWKKV